MERAMSAYSIPIAIPLTRSCGSSDNMPRPPSSRARPRRRRGAAPSLLLPPRPDAGGADRKPGKGPPADMRGAAAGVSLPSAALDFRPLPAAIRDAPRRGEAGGGGGTRRRRREKRTGAARPAPAAGLPAPAQCSGWPYAVKITSFPSSSSPLKYMSLTPTC